MKVVVNLQNSQEEKVLLAFMDSLGYDYQTIPDATDQTGLQSSAESESTTRSWDEIREDLLNLFN